MFPVLLDSTKNRQGAWPVSPVLRAELPFMLELSARLTVSPHGSFPKEKPYSAMRIQQDTSALALLESGDRQFFIWGGCPLCERVFIQQQHWSLPVRSWKHLLHAYQIVTTELSPNNAKYLLNGGAGGQNCPPLSTTGSIA